MIAKRFHSLRKFYEHYGLSYVRSRDAKDVFTKTALYELRPLLSKVFWSLEVDPRGAYSDKLSNYWKITSQGLSKLQELFPNDKELMDRINNDICLIAKNILAN